jgi:hypothetical protein
MTNPETLPQLHRQTADVLERLEKGEKIALQGKNTHWNTWFDATRADAWVFLREKPAEKTPEQLRVEANLALKAEWEKASKDGKEFQTDWRYSDGSSPWRANTAFHHGIWSGLTSHEYEYRRKPAPAPVIVPWSFEDQICGMVVESKDRRHRGSITDQLKGSAYVMLLGRRYTYPELLSDWQQVVQVAGGVEYKPCGKEQG